MKEQYRTLACINIMSDEKKGKKQDSRDTSKEADGLDGVTGNAEDELGDMFLGMRERELLYGEDSLLALYGPILHHVCHAIDVCITHLWLWLARFLGLCPYALA